MSALSDAPVKHCRPDQHGEADIELRRRQVGKSLTDDPPAWPARQCTREHHCLNWR